MYSSFYDISDINDQIEYGMDLDISHSILHNKAKFKDKYDVKIIHCAQSLLTRYMDLLEEYVEVVEMTEAEFAKYRYKPKTLSLDQYGTTELWSSILLLNHMDSVVEFNKRKLRMFKTNILDIIEELLILEEDNMRDNKEYIEQD